jgi:ABC-type Fe3+-hydroxamate transport system substrate-binding protein
MACGPSQEVTSAASDSSSPAPARVRSVASLSPAASQFLLALGVGDRIVAVDPRSSEIPTLGDHPVVDLPAASRFAPDLILSPAAAAEAPLARESSAVGHEVVVFEPHSLEEAFALCRALGARLVGAARATAFEHALSRELAEVAGASFGRPRPRVAAVIGSAPLEFAGGHSFITDFIEIAGGTSVTHGGGEQRIAVDANRLADFAPDLLLVVGASERSQDERRAIRQALPATYRIEFFVFDPDRFWIREESVAAARRLRAVIEPISRELEQLAKGLDR